MRGLIAMNTPALPTRDRVAGTSGHRWSVAAAAPAYFGTCLLLLFLVVPIVALVARTSPAGLLRSLRDPQTIDAIRLSLQTSAVSLTVTILLGTPLAYLLARRRFVGRSAVEALIDLPTVLPPAVAGIALLMAFGRRGVIGTWLEPAGIEVAFTRAAVVMAQTFVAAPYFIKSAAVGLASVRQDLLDAAALDGASPAQTWWHVTLPLARRGLVGGAALCWSRALGEFGATILFAGNFPGRTQTMPLAIYMGFQIDLNRALTLSVLLLGISFAILLIVRATQRAEVFE
jgi:molybdate transport system permease protein